MRASFWSLIFKDVFETNGREIPVGRTSLGSRDPKRLGRPEKAQGLFILLKSNFGHFW